MIDDKITRCVLPEAHWKYLTESLGLTDALAERVRKGLQRRTSKGQFEIALSIDDADEIRNLCAERLQTLGFDGNYAPTQAGYILEDLIDLFFTG